MLNLLNLYLKEKIDDIPHKMPWSRDAEYEITLHLFLTEDQFETFAC